MFKTHYTKDKIIIKTYCPIKKRPHIMKAIKYIFAILLFANFAISCSNDSSEDDELYNVEQVQATGEEGTASIITSRD